MWWTWLILLIVIIILVVFLVFLNIAHNTIFQPRRKHKYKPKYQYQNLWLTVNNIHGEHYEVKPKKGKYIHCWYFNYYSNRKTVLFFHGNTGNISYRDYVIDLCHEFKLNLLLVDYQGYGYSDGKCSITNVYSDALNAYYFLVNNNVLTRDIIIWGESLGGAPAIYVASKMRCGKLILFSTFSNLKEVLKYYPDATDTTKSLANSIDYLYTNIPNNTRLTKVYCPVMIIHSIEDDLIGYECARSLYRAIPHPRKSILTIKGQHSSPKMKEKHLATLLNFCTIDSGLQEEGKLEYTLDKLEEISNEYHQYIKQER